MPKSSKKKKTGSRRSAPPPPMMDRRLMDRTMLQMQKLLSDQDFESLEEANAFVDKVLAEGKLSDIFPVTPQEEALELMFQAFDSSGTKRIQLARQALSIDPDCADAYCLLAEETSKSAREALRLYRRAVDAGERSLGSEVFDEAAGHFWGMIETRPYMRAMMGLAITFYTVGQRDDAISTWQRMIDLNPGDNQGARELLVDALLREQRTAEAGDLLDHYEDEYTACWTYSRALWAFQKEGDTPFSESALGAALACNKHVIPYLIGESVVDGFPESYAPGSLEEALIYASGGVPTWHVTTGAVRWLCRFLNIDDSTSRSGASA